MRYSSIKVFVRRKLEIEHIKVLEHIVDVENVMSYIDDVRGDDLFICLGTTKKKAGTISRYEELDRDMPFNIAKAAKDKGAKKIAVVSSLGANSKSRNYYTRIKGEMEEKIISLQMSRTVIARPSMLLGNRKEIRFAEAVGKVFMKLFSFVLFGRLKVFRAIHGRAVAVAMIDLINRDSTKTLYQSDELASIAANHKNE